MTEERNVQVAAVDDFEVIMTPKAWSSTGMMGRAVMVTGKKNY